MALSKLYPRRDKSYKITSDSSLFGTRVLGETIAKVKQTLITGLSYDANHPTNHETEDVPSNVSNNKLESTYHSFQPDECKHVDSEAERDIYQGIRKSIRDGYEQAMFRDIMEATSPKGARIVPDVFLPNPDFKHSADEGMESSASPDWAHGLPPDFLDKLARHLGSDCEENDWNSIQAVFTAGSVCRSWREAVNRVCFQSADPQSKHCKGPSLIDRAVVHPKQLLGKCATQDEIIRCYIVRNRPKSPFGNRKYKLVLGADYTKVGKSLLVAHHRLTAAKSTYHVYLSEADSKVPSRKLGHLLSSPFGTTFEIVSSNSLHSFPVRRKHSAEIRYSFNMLGGRGPRSVRVTIPHLEESACQSFASDAPSCGSYNGGHHDQGESKGCNNEENQDIVFENKLPRWHDLLQCWCLDFGGRVKCASVKNFQLVSQHSPDEIILQFGKVESDIFTMDFCPRILSAQEAFMICLSSFDAKLSCF